MDRKDVYKIIDNERNYQNTRWKDREQLSLSGELLVMDAYLSKAKRSYIGAFGRRVALDQIRKVVAIGVRCLENHGEKVIRR